MICLSSLNDKLKDIYFTYKDEIKPPVPINDIKKFLELEGVFLEDNNAK